MKRTPMTAALAIAALAGSAGIASAQAFSLENSYFKGFGGATWPRDLDTTLFEDGEQIAAPSFDHDTGYTLGIAVGAAVAPNIALELEYTYRKADFTVRDRAEGDQTDGDTSARAFMVNALYMFDSMGPTGSIQPYVGAGIGAAMPVPWPMWQPISSSVRACAGDSTPSATTVHWKVRARPITPSTMARSCASSSMWCTKERSIFSTSTGSCCR